MISTQFAIPQTMSEHDSISINNKKKRHLGYQKGNPSSADPIYRPPHKPTEILLHVIPRKCMDSDTDTLEQDINTDVKENSPCQEGVISEMYQKPDKSYFEEPPEL